MDLNVYNISYVVGLFGEPQQVHYAANVERGIDTSGILTMDYRQFQGGVRGSKGLRGSRTLPDPGHKGISDAEVHPQFLRGVTFHPHTGKEEHFNLNGGRPRQAAESLRPLPAPLRTGIRSFAAGCWTPRWQ